jgi:uncharacterized protein
MSEALLPSRVPPPEPQPVNEWVEARHSPIHGRGLFAARDIPAGTRLLEYAGERIPKAESLRRCQAGNVYIIALDDEWDLDGSVEPNPARFINHSCQPNCEAVLEEEVTLAMADTPAPADGEFACEGVTTESHIFIDAVRAISAGEEISFNYGYDLIDYREHPCRCGAAHCVGYIVAEEFFPSLSKRIQRQRETSP